jgi:hypothetical protein
MPSGLLTSRFPSALVNVYPNQSQCKLRRSKFVSADSNNGEPIIISANKQPTDHMSTAAIDRMSAEQSRASATP